MDALVMPTVSVVIVNYNYNDYLRSAFESVRNQTYPQIEIVIVDDKSTDQSVQTIDEICSKFPDVLAVKSTVNGGQSVASFKGLSASSGDYILFLDADDLLLPESVEAHIYTHLSSRIPVAFTTVDVLNNKSGRDINMSHDGFSEYIKSGRGRRPREFRSINESLPNSWFGGRRPAVTSRQIHFVLPPQVDPWVWSPTSANCYRRDAVLMLLKEPGLDRIRWGTDAFLIRPLSGLFGSILIDRPLVRYIIHKSNRFVKSAPLNQFLLFDTLNTSDDIRMIARVGLERIILDTRDNGHRYANPSSFFRALQALGECWPGPRHDEKPGEYYTKLLLENRSLLTSIFGAPLVDHIIRQRPSPTVASRVLDLFLARRSG